MKRPTVFCCRLTWTLPQIRSMWLSTCALLLFLPFVTRVELGGGEIQVRRQEKTLGLFLYIFRSYISHAHYIVFLLRNFAYVRDYTGLPSRGLSEVMGMVWETILRNMVMDKRIVTPEHNINKNVTNLQDCYIKIRLNIFAEFAM